MASLIVPEKESFFLWSKLNLLKEHSSSSLSLATLQVLSINMTIQAGWMGSLNLESSMLRVHDVDSDVTSSLSLSLVQSVTVTVTVTVHGAHFPTHTPRSQRLQPNHRQAIWSHRFPPRVSCFLSKASQNHTKKWLKNIHVYSASKFSH